MSDHNSFSSIDLFKAPASTSSSGLAAYGDTNKGNSFDLSFSRELSLASERAVPTRKTSQPSRHGGLDKGERRPLSHSHETQRTEANAATKNVTREPADRTEDVSNATKKDRGSLKTESEARSPANENVTSESDRSAKSAASELDGRKPPATEQKLLTNGNDAQLAETAIAGEIPAQAEWLPDSEMTETTDGGSPVGVSTEPAELNIDAIASVKTAEIPAGSGLSALERGDSGAKRLETGEQLSPGQLANRQAHLLKTASARDKTSVALTNDVVTEEKPDADSVELATRSAKALPIAASGFVDVQREKDQKLASSNTRVVDGVAVKPSALQLNTGEISASRTELKDAQLADVEAAANTRSILMAQKNEQQTLATNLTQSLQLAQQQAQNLNLATTAMNAEPVDRLPQSSDNTFLSLQGGIVTAPSVARPDAGYSQGINAPVNLPILQNDAEKAMAGNIRWMVNEGVKNAVVNVTPSGMGPISVTIGIEKDQMSVSIVALQGSTREALDSMLPRLREQLATQGHDSVRVDVSDGQAEQSARGYGQHSNDEQNGEELMSGTEKLTDDADDSSDSGEQATSDGTSGLVTTINEQGQIRNRYDVYV